MKDPTSPKRSKGQRWAKDPFFRVIRLIEPAFSDRIRARHRKIGRRPRRPKLVLALRPSPVPKESRLFVQQFHFPGFFSRPFAMAMTMNLQIGFFQSQESSVPFARRPAGNAGLAGRSVFLFGRDWVSRATHHKRDFLGKPFSGGNAVQQGWIARSLVTSGPKGSEFPGRLRMDPKGRMTGTLVGPPQGLGAGRGSGAHAKGRVGGTLLNMGTGRPGFAGDRMLDPKRSGWSIFRFPLMPGCQRISFSPPPSPSPLKGEGISSRISMASPFSRFGEMQKGRVGGTITRGIKFEGSFPVTRSLRPLFLPAGLGPFLEPLIFSSPLRGEGGAGVMISRDFKISQFDPLHRRGGREFSDGGRFFSSFPRPVLRLASRIQGDRLEKGDAGSPSAFTRRSSPPLEWRKESFSRSDEGAEKTLPIQAPVKASRLAADGRSPAAANSPPTDVNRLADQVYQVIERRVRREREWRGRR
jgi:hypothetical protein